MYSALNIAKYVIAYEHKKDHWITNLRLQKILYFIQADFLVNAKRPCFYEDIVAWGFGPTVPCVFYEYKIFAGLDIIMREEAPKLDKKTAKRINAMLETCSHYSTTQLVDITCQQKPWVDAYREDKDAVIPREAIREFFK